MVKPASPRTATATSNDTGRFCAVASYTPVSASSAKPSRANGNAYRGTFPIRLSLADRPGAQEQNGGSSRGSPTGAQRPSTFSYCQRAPRAAI